MYELKTNTYTAPTWHENGKLLKINYNPICYYQLWFCKIVYEWSFINCDWQSVFLQAMRALIINNFDKQIWGFHLKFNFYGSEIFSKVYVEKKLHNSLEFKLKNVNPRDAKKKKKTFNFDTFLLSYIPSIYALNLNSSTL